MINERLSKLRSLMSKHNISAYIVPSEDFHQSEYVGDYFKARAFISGFTGSAGMAIITGNEAHLWTDGRYFTQAEIELKNSEYILEKSGTAGVLTPIEFLKRHLKTGENIGFDGRTVSVDGGYSYEELAKAKNSKIIYDLDLVGEVWNDRPSLSKEKAFFLPLKYSGESSESKIKRIRDEMANIGANTHLIASLDDICWILNIRGKDVSFSPLLLSYAVITENDFHFFVDKSKFDNELIDYLNSLKITLHDYDSVYDFVKSFNEKNKILLNPSKLNYTVFKNIPDSSTLIKKMNPSTLFKACKNETELKNIRNSHIKDGVAWVKFMRWLKDNVGKIEITEIDASDKLESFRKEQDGYLWPSFSPISGYGANAAIVHYSASPESEAKLQAKGLYLSDTGGNYYEGSTDITRTLALGELTKEERYHFTLVLKSNLNLGAAKFISGTSGYALDILARKPLWDRGLNFNHGTGHGVGYLLNIHEGPAGIRYAINPAIIDHHPIKEGMVITNEPGIYIAGSHGIRTENEMIAVLDEKTDFGVFMKFETCTYVPIDLDAIDFDLLNDEEKSLLNDYHKKVFDIISPFLSKDEIEWLKHYTRNV